MPENFIALMRSLKTMYEDFILKYDQWMGIDSVGLSGKVDKVVGKGLSTNDYSTLEKDKLSSIEQGANNYTHPASHPVAIINGQLYPMQFIKTDANGNTGFGYVNWSEITGKPSDMDNVEFTTHKGVPNGYCPLGSNGKIDPNYIDSLNAFDTFFPADIASMLMLNAGLGDFAFVPVGVDGDGNTIYDNYQLGALPASTQANWKKINIIGVSSVNGKHGVVVLSSDDISEGLGNLYFTNERVDDRVASLLTAGTNITITYDDATGAIMISADDVSVEFAQIQNMPTTLAGHGIADAYTKTETDTNIANALASLVDASPDTLNTLNELAAALGDDPAFATTMATLIGTKAPTNNPVFTGSIGLPQWTTATRPTLGVDDRATGFNNDLNSEETWNGTAWVASEDIAAMIHSAAAKTSLANLDEFGVYDSVTGLLKKVSSENVIGGIKTGFKNYIINGNFDVWQYGTSQTSNGYGSDDRWSNANVGSTKTHSKSGATLPTGEIANTSNTVVSSVNGVSNRVNKTQFIENVLRLAGKTVTLSFYAKADSNKNIAIEFEQNFGTGGSPSAQVNSIGSQLVALTTSWQKHSITVNIPSASSKTIGTDGVHTSSTAINFWFDTGSNLNARTASLGQQSGTFSIAQVQIEEGSVATPFENRPYGLELSLCQRYAPVFGGDSSLYLEMSGHGLTTTTTWLSANFPVKTRIAPTGITVISVGSIRIQNPVDGTSGACSNIVFNSSSNTTGRLVATTTAGSPNIAGHNNMIPYSDIASAKIIFTGCEL